LADSTTPARNAVELRNIVKRFGAFTAVHRMDLDVERGSFVTFVGPSGCGKTTTLRMIAGLENATEGDIRIKGQRVNDVPIHKRNLGIVFQNYALFPHKTIYENVAFGLKYRDVDKETARRKVREALKLVRLPDVEERVPKQLSGGQQQRIALARAIVIEPDVLLLDEPLSALDANLREEMRVELKRIQRELGISTIFVTHDQSEALAMSDKVVVMSDGWIEQEGTPEEVYNEPASEFVANFLGISNIFSGRVTALAGDTAHIRLDDGVELLGHPREGRAAREGERVRLAVRAEKVFLSANAPTADDSSVILDGTVTAVDYQGQAARYFLDAGPLKLQAINPIDRRPFDEGQPVKLRIRAQDVVLLDAEAADSAAAKQAAE
jgi:putative spermidine/putrescine transport system ATP-binding protein/spermidine/putrescine transport system ATP-binding protein